MAKKDEDDTADEAELPAKKKSSGRLPLWLEEAWEGWVKSVGVLLLCAVAYILYKFDLVAERTAGWVAVVAVVVGALWATVPLAWERVKSRGPAAKALFVVMVATWAAGTGYPSLRAAMPPAPLADAHITPGALSAKLPVKTTGPLELSVLGRFKSAGGEAEASYDLKVEGGGQSEQVSGLLKRSLMRVRTSRRGGTSTTVTEHTEQSHRLASVHGPEITVSAENVDEQLEDGLIIHARPAGPEPLVFIILGAFAVLCAIGFDARLVEPRVKEKTYLTAASALALVFSIRFPIAATPHSLVRPAVDALFLAAVSGGLGGYLVAFVARAGFGPKLPKKAGRK
jgi:hypothetical protein